MNRNIIFLDCDSTLSAIEGIDELARFRGPEVYDACQNMTNRAMEGEIPIEAVYGERLKLIRPTRLECEQVGQMYIDTVEPDARQLIAWLESNGWEPVIVSGGLTQAILPFARFLKVDEIRAVDVFFDEKGHYDCFLESAPTSRMGGKIEVIEQLRRERRPERIVMVGDGASDLETKDGVDLFVGFGGFVERELVKKESPAYIKRLSELPSVLDGRWRSNA